MLLWVYYYKGKMEKDEPLFMHMHTFCSNYKIQKYVSITPKASGHNYILNNLAFVNICFNTRSRGVFNSCTPKAISHSLLKLENSQVSNKLLISKIRHTQSSI
jgi:hypothetical protein